MFYDPANPSIAALDNLWTMGDWKTLACAVAGFVVSTLIPFVYVWTVWLGFSRSNDRGAPAVTDGPGAVTV